MFRCGWTKTTTMNHIRWLQRPPPHYHRWDGKFVPSSIFHNNNNNNNNIKTTMVWRSFAAAAAQKRGSSNRLRWDRDFESFGKNKRVGPNAIDPLAGEGIYWGDRGPEQKYARLKKVRFQDIKPSPSRIFVANIAWSVSDEMLKQHMESCIGNNGRVKEVIIQYTEQGKHLGFGLVEFETPAQADQAVQSVHQTVLHQRALSVRKDQHQGIHTFRGEMVRVEHIPIDIAWEAFKAHMNQYSGNGMQSCQYFNTYRGDEKYGNLFFRTEQDAKQAALLLNGTLLRGKKITATYVSRDRREEVLQRGYEV